MAENYDELLRALALYANGADAYCQSAQAAAAAIRALQAENARVTEERDALNEALHDEQTERQMSEAHLAALREKAEGKT